MSIAEKFATFYENLKMSDTTVSNISYRYKQITKRINLDFRALNSETAYSLFVGSYGRDTEIHTSDIDIILELPSSTYVQYNNYSGNGQSALIQSVKNTIQKTYSRTDLRGDGQVVVIAFDDGIRYEIVPAFLNKDGISYTYPDTNNGGSWKQTNPRMEISAIKVRNDATNKNLKRLCRMVRAWKDEWHVPMGGLLIDTLAYNFIDSWAYKDKSFFYYDWLSRDFFSYLKNKENSQQYWLAPGSNSYVWKQGDFQYKALRCYNLALEAIDYEGRNMPYSANQKWREIYGSKFTG